MKRRPMNATTAMSGIGNNVLVTIGNNVLDVEL